MKKMIAMFLAFMMLCTAGIVLAEGTGLSQSETAGDAIDAAGEKKTRAGDDETIRTIDEMILMMNSGMAVSGAEGTAKPQITGRIEDGCYVLTVEMDPKDSGKWQADEMAQDPFVVKLASSGTENGVFTARYEPTGDGEVAVNLRHFNAHTCDQLHSFNLLVENGKVQEATGGSYTASPSEEDLDPLFSGEWLEKDSQFIVLDVTKKLGDGWEIEVSSPVSHGAWVIRATAYYDCDYGALVYADGVRYDLIPGEKTTEKEASSGLWGTLKPEGTPEDLQLVWYDMENTEGETVTFETAPALPPYAYTGADPIEGAIANALAADERASLYLTEPGYVTIPCPIILKTDMADETHARVYGDFWILNYVKRGERLINISGGEYPAVIQMEKKDGEWRVTAMEEAGDGDDYTADIERFAEGDQELEEKYFAAADLGAAEQQDIRTRFIREYAEANNIGVTAYQDYGWDPIPLQ